MNDILIENYSTKSNNSSTSQSSTSSTRAPLRLMVEIINESLKNRDFFSHTPTHHPVLEPDLTREKNKKKLEKFRLLPNDWNGNGSLPFTGDLIDRAWSIIRSLDRQPQIFPTACNSIQLEYEIDDQNYLEFEIFAEGIEFLQVKDGVESEGKISENDIAEVVETFYV